MKNYILIIIIFILSIATANAKVLVKGYYINTNNDTVYVTYKISTIEHGYAPNLEYLQKSIAIIGADNKKTILKPIMAKEICFTFFKEEYHLYSQCLNCDFSLGNNIFLQKKVSGKLNLYVRLKTESNGGFSGGMYYGGSSYITEHYILQKENGLLYEVSRLYFKQDIKNYIDDCPSLYNKIDKGIYKYDDTETIVDFYNRDCK